MSEPISRRGLPERVKMRHSTHFVEQLAHRHETPVGRMVPLASRMTTSRGGDCGPGRIESAVIRQAQPITSVSTSKPPAMASQMRRYRRRENGLEGMGSL